MKSSLLTLLFILPLMVSGQETVKKTQTLDHGYSKEVFYVLKSDKKIMHGSYLKTGPKGIIFEEGSYKNGLRDSIWKDYGWDGKLKMTGIYKAGKMVDVWEFYDYKGNLEQKYDFTNYKLIYYNLKEEEKEKDYIMITPEGNRKVIPDRPPLYIGGSAVILDIINKNLKYPVIAQETGIMGSVKIAFIIDSIGKPSDYRIIKGIGSGCDEEALRVVKMMTDWLPGVFEGQAVKVWYIMPVNYKLQ